MVLQTFFVDLRVDIEWLNDYFVLYIAIMFSYIIVIFSPAPQAMLIHDVLFLIFVLYCGSKAAAMRDPYSDIHVAIEEAEAEQKSGNDEISTDSNEYIGFEKSLQRYKTKLEQWMAAEHPYRNKDFKLTDLMDVLPLNRSYLSRLLNEVFGETFFQFVMRYRIEESSQLLATRPDLNANQIAEMCGFSSASVFGRAFLKERDVTPKQYRMGIRK